MRRAITGLGCRLLVALCAGAWCAGCERDPEPRVLSCDLPHTGRVLDGEWTLTGDGRRENCKARRLEGDLHLRTSMPIEVNAAAQPTTGRVTGPVAESEADAFVDRIERADFVLSATDDAPEALSLSGEVVGSCVQFTLIEELPDGDRLEYDFQGYITGGSFAEGEFTGTGPEDCEVHGRFELLVR